MMFGWFKDDPRPNPAPAPKAFSQPVSGGYVDDRGVWFATKDEADLASAVRHMVGEARDSRLINGLGHCRFDALGFELSLADLDTVNAMAIIARVRLAAGDN